MRNDKQYSHEDDGNVQDEEDEELNNDSTL